MTAEGKRPIGIVAIVIITAISAAIGIIVFVPILLLVQTVPLWLLLVALVAVAISIIEVVVCYGLWTYQNWGIKIAVPVYVISIVLEVLGIFLEKPLTGKTTTGNVILELVFVAVYIWMLSYLSRGEVKRLYSD